MFSRISPQRPGFQYQHMGVSGATNQNKSHATWESCYMELCQNLQSGENFTSLEPPPHSNVSMDTIPHYDPSSGESISTQTWRLLTQCQQIKPALSLGDNWNASSLPRYPLLELCSGEIPNGVSLIHSTGLNCPAEGILVVCSITHSHRGKTSMAS